MIKTIEQLDRLVMETPLPDVPDGFATRVMQQIEAEKVQAKPKFVLATDEVVQFILGLLGLLLTTTSLVRFIFSAWLITAVAN
jgi:hypothetical protein